jgi:hypothetical protein
MRIQKSGFLKNCGFLGIITSVLLIMSIVVAGCTQGSSDNAGQPAAGSSTTANSGNSAPGQDAAIAAPADTARQGAGVSLSGTSPGGQHTGGNFLTNETHLAAAAQTLGVSETDLKNALTPPAQGRVNFTAAAAQLGVTSDQLSSALGIPAGGFGNGTRQRGGYNATNGRAPSGA